MERDRRRRATPPPPSPSRLTGLPSPLRPPPGRRWVPILRFGGGALRRAAILQKEIRGISAVAIAVSPPKQPPIVWSAFLLFDRRQALPLLVGGRNNGALRSTTRFHCTTSAPPFPSRCHSPQTCRRPRLPPPPVAGGRRLGLSWWARRRALCGQTAIEPSLVSASRCALARGGSRGGGGGSGGRGRCRDSGGGGCDQQQLWSRRWPWRWRILHCARLSTGHQPARSAPGCRRRRPPAATPLLPPMPPGRLAARRKRPRPTSGAWPPAINARGAGQAVDGDRISFSLARYRLWYDGGQPRGPRGPATVPPPNR